MCAYIYCRLVCFFFFSSRRRHTRLVSDWSSDVCSSDLDIARCANVQAGAHCICLMPASRITLAQRAISRLICAENSSGVLRSEERRVGKEGRCWGGGGE